MRAIFHAIELFLIQIQCPLVFGSNFDNHRYYFIPESIFVELVAQLGLSIVNTYRETLKIYSHL